MTGRLKRGVIIGGICATLSQSFAAQANSLEQLLRQLRSQDVTVQTLATLYNLRTNAPNADIQVSVVRACAVGLLYLGQHETYRTRVRGNVPEVTAFERSLLEKCEPCKGGGKLTVTCPKCKGDGECKNFTCTHGTSEFKGFDGRVVYRRCSVCKGTAKCTECEATGRVTKTCHTCGGRGGTFSASTALAVYRNQVEAAIAAFDAKHRHEAEQLAKAQFEARLREIEIAAKHEAILVEAKAAAEERVRQSALAEREAAERARKAAEEAKYAALDKEYLKSIVVIEGDRSVGTGFLCQFKGKKVLFSNAHVLFGNRSLRLRTIGGQDLKYTRILICRNRDIVAYELDKYDGLSWLNIHQNMRDINNQEAVVVFGNSGGGGVVTTLRGKIQGIGPDRVEVDAKFVHGNSGSPIVAYPYNAVVGMATYATCDPQVDWVTRSTRFAEVRRFGVRIDNVNWSDFFPLDTQEYAHALDVFQNIVAFAEKEVMKAQWQGRYYRATGYIKARAEHLLEQYKATPEWMRQYAEDAALAAYVCVLILN